MGHLNFTKSSLSIQSFVVVCMVYILYILNCYNAPGGAYDGPVDRVSFNRGNSCAQLHVQSVDCAGSAATVVCSVRVVVRVKQRLVHPGGAGGSVIVTVHRGRGSGCGAFQDGTAMHYTRQSK